MENIKNAYVWQEAIELSQKLVEVCEAFSNPDANVLVWHLRQAVVEVPATIAADLQAERGATMEPVVRLAVELELVRKVYPAIDTSGVEEQLVTLMTRMRSEAFTEREPEETIDPQELPVEAEGEAVVEPAPQPAAGTVIVPNVDGVSGNPGVVSIQHDQEGE